MSTPIDPPQSRRAARQAEVTAQDARPDVAAPPLTRRERGSAPANLPPSAPGDVSYRTEIRPRVPHYDAPPIDHPVIGADGRPIAGAGATLPGTASAGMPPHVAPPLVEPLVVRPMAPPVAPPAANGGAQMRRRDFRPPADQTGEQPSAQQSAQASFPGVAESAWGGGADAPLDYHTQLSSAVYPSAPPVDPIQPSHAPESWSPPSESTLSRRELRELRDRLDGGSPAPTGLPEFGDAAGPAGSTGAQPAFTQPAFAPSDGAPSGYAPPSSPPTAFVDPRLSPQPIAEAPPGSATEALYPTQPPSFAPPMAHAGLQAPTTVAEPVAEPVTPVPSPPSTATGSHWSVGIHDDEDPFVNTFSREVGSAVSLSNTNALVLPEMPTGGISGPVAGTGEIIITGMIDVPRVVSSTGAVPAVHESAEIDDLFDPGDLTAAPADAAPVSALKAVSSHTSSHSVIAVGRRPASNTITTVLVASTVVMAVVAIGLFVIAAANGLF